MNDQEQKKIFSHNLNTCLEVSGKTQREVAAAISVSPQTFNTWCRGIALPRMGKVQKLADYFHVSKADLIDDSTICLGSSGQILRIPVYSSISRDFPNPSSQNKIGTEPFISSVGTEDDYFALKVSDDSMEPKFSPADTVIASRQTDAGNGDIVVAFTGEDSDALIRRLCKYASGTALIASNPSYEPIFQPSGNLPSQIRIVGRIMELRSHF